MGLIFYHRQNRICSEIFRAEGPALPLAEQLINFYADKKANGIAGQTKENTDKQIVLLIIFIIRLTNITESKPKCKVTYILSTFNIIDAKFLFG